MTVNQTASPKRFTGHREMFNANNHQKENIMTLNVGTIDRILRAIIGLGLIGAAFGVYGAAYQTVWGWLGIIPLATSVLSSCPVYSMIGIKTSSPAKVEGP